MLTMPVTVASLDLIAHAQICGDATIGVVRLRASAILFSKQHLAAIQNSLKIDP
jgi:branched-subunit amino acid aminotransferase/4-amino-4-deoxychorismate lyase